MRKLILACVLVSCAALPGLGGQSIPLGALQVALGPSGSSPIGRWLLNEGGAATTILDSSGGGNNFTWSGTKGCSGSYYTTGYVLSYAGCFDGSTSSATRAYTPVLDVAGNFTVSLWIKNPAGQSYSYVFGNRYGTVGGFQVIVGPSSEIYLQIVTSGGVPNVNTFGSGYSLPNSWVHYCGVASTDAGGTLAIYMNGVQKAYGTGEGVSLTSGGNPIVIGGPNTYQGALEDIRLYNTALTQAQCAAIYSAGPGA